MAEILLMKTIKFFLSFVCYFGTGIAFIDMQRGVSIGDAVKMSSALQKIVIWLFIIAWVIKIIWFCFDKFYLERKERLQKIRKNEKDGKE